MKKSRVLLGGADHFKVCERKRSRKNVNLCLWTGGCYERFSPQEASKRIFRYFKEMCSIRGAFFVATANLFFLHRLLGCDDDPRDVDVVRGEERMRNRWELENVSISIRTHGFYRLMNQARGIQILT